MEVMNKQRMKTRQILLFHPKREHKQQMRLNKNETKQDGIKFFQRQLRKLDR